MKTKKEIIKKIIFYFDKYIEKLDNGEITRTTRIEYSSIINALLWTIDLPEVSLNTAKKGWKETLIIMLKNSIKEEKNEV